MRGIRCRGGARNLREVYASRQPRPLGRRLPRSWWVAELLWLRKVRSIKLEVWSAAIELLDRCLGLKCSSPHCLDVKGSDVDLHRGARTISQVLPVPERGGAEPHVAPQAIPLDRR